MPHGGQALLSELELAEELRGAAVVELIETALRANSSIRLRAQGTSMVPAIWPGDLLTIIPAQSRFPEIHEVAVVRIGESLRAHRVAQLLEGGGMLTQGDALRHPDPAIAREEVLGTAIARNGQALRRGRARWGVVAALRGAVHLWLLPIALESYRKARRSRRNGRA